MFFSFRKKIPSPAEPDAERETAISAAAADDYPYALASLAAGCGAILGILLIASTRLLFPSLFTAPLPSLLLGLLPFQLLACGAAVLTLRAASSERSLALALGLSGSSDLSWALPRRVLLQLLRLYPAMILVNLSALALCRHYGLALPEQALSYYARQDCSTLFWTVAALSVVTIAPLCEELLFRQIIYRGIRHLAPAGAGLWTALAFSLFHGLPHYAPAIFILGLFLQRARQEGGLPQAILLHSLFNLISLLLIVLKTSCAPSL
jgi:membrane protease YdiL (CAAX protease family)